MHTQVADTYTVPSTALLPALDHLKANDSIQKSSQQARDFEIWLIPTVKSG